MEPVAPPEELPDAWAEEEEDWQRLGAAELLQLAVLQALAEETREEEGRAEAVPQALPLPLAVSLEGGIEAFPLPELQPEGAWEAEELPENVCDTESAAEEEAPELMLPVRLTVGDRVGEADQAALELKEPEAEEELHCKPEPLRSAEALGVELREAREDRDCLTELDLLCIPEGLALLPAEGDVDTRLMLLLLEAGVAEGLLPILAEPVWRSEALRLPLLQAVEDALPDTVGDAQEVAELTGERLLL